MFQVKENVISECLYLQKEEKNDVFLNDCHLLKQHQIDGLRFLYLQFKKKKPAAVINFPSKCGKSVIVALFLSVLKNLINKPILILCSNKSEINVWNDIILKWTEYTTDNIAIDSSNVYIKKKIFIKHIEDLTRPYLIHSWSVLILKDDINKNICKHAFNAEFKIWITSSDVKKDLKMLSIIYNWLTKLPMEAKDFMPSEKSIREKVQKTVLLDSFLEDFLFQETRIEPFTKAQINQPPEIDTHKVSAPKKSRKNKDATGTKIKRSKKNINNDNVITNNDCQNQTIEQHNDINNEVNDHIQITTEQNEHNENKNSESLLENYDNVIDINMKEDLTEEFSFGNAAQNIVENENVLSNKTTESMDFDEIAVKMNNNDACDENNDDSNMDTLMECNESNEKCQREDKMTDNKECFVKSVDSNLTDGMVVNELGDSVVKNKLVLNESMDMKEKGTDLEVNGQCHKDIDTKISELEEKALKKFKGSLLDSIF